jgi:hypothetical protein
MTSTQNIINLASLQSTAAPAWHAACIKGTAGKPLSILANALIGLEAEMPDVVAYDEMLCAAMLLHPLDQATTGFSPRPCTDVDVGVMQKRLQHLGLPGLGKDVTHQAVDIRAAECSYHPVRNYLRGLQWDGVDRIASLFPVYFGSEDSAYATAIGRDEHGRADLGARLQSGSYDRARRSTGHAQEHGLRDPWRRLLQRQFAGDRRRQGRVAAPARQMAH